MYNSRSVKNMAQNIGYNTRITCMLESNQESNVITPEEQSTEDVSP